ncbi:MAG: hypothetical protein AABW79_02745 [Nanoarchaeota archaeon]
MPTTYEAHKIQGRNPYNAAVRIRNNSEDCLRVSEEDDIYSLFLKNDISLVLGKAENFRLNGDLRAEELILGIPDNANRKQVLSILESAKIEAKDLKRTFNF